MGFDGVLVRKQDGTYIEVGVGTYRRETPSITQLLLTLFPGEAIMALVFGSLGAMLVASRRRLPLFQRLASFAAGLLWIIVAVLFPPALSVTNYLAAGLLLVLMAAGLVLFIFVLYELIKAFSKSHPSFNHILLTFFAGGFIFFLPFVAWITNILPDYRLAQFLGLILGSGWIYDQYRRRHNQEFK
jgi:hypothetical protein